MSSDQALKEERGIAGKIERLTDSGKKRDYKADYSWEKFVSSSNEM